MLLVIITNSLIRLNSTVKLIMTITQTEYDDNRHGRYKTKIVIMSIDEADSVGTRGYASITKSYNERE